MASKAKKSVAVVVLVGLALLLWFWLPFRGAFLNLFVFDFFVIILMGFGFYLIYKRLQSKFFFLIILRDVKLSKELWLLEWAIFDAINHISQ